MKHIRMSAKFIFAIACVAGLFAANAPAATESSTEISLTRLDCGNTVTVPDANRFSDIQGYNGLKVPLTFSCYLIKHGDDYLLWDTGNPSSESGNKAPTAPKVSLVAQLAQLHLEPEQIKFVASVTITAITWGRWHRFRNRHC